MAYGFDERRPLLQAGRPGGEGQPAPHGEHRPQRHPTENPAELDRSAGPTYSFQISTQWRQALSLDDVPIQLSGEPGTVVQLSNPGGPVNLQWGPIQPVSQLGSQQLTFGKLVQNPDGSVTIWIGPKPPDGAPATNWIPTPSNVYYAAIYGPQVSVTPASLPIIRIYYPAPGSDTQASILPPPNGSMGATYVFPALQQVG